MNYQGWQAAVTLLEQQHHALEQIVQDVPACQAGTTGNACLKSCPEIKACKVKVRNTMHNLLYAMTAHFQQEYNCMHGMLPLEHIEAHAEAHAHILEELNRTIHSFAANDLSLHAIAGLQQVSQDLLDHTRTWDAEMDALYKLPGKSSTPSQDK